MSLSTRGAVGALVLVILCAAPACKPGNTTPEEALYATRLGGEWVACGGDHPTLGQESRDCTSG